MDNDYMDILFGGPQDHVVVVAALAAAEAAEAARLSSLKAEAATASAASRCRRCGGTGWLSQFMHRNNGICFGCGGSGAA